VAVNVTASPAQAVIGPAGLTSIDGLQQLSTVTVTSFEVAGLHPKPSHEYTQRYFQLEISKFVDTERLSELVPVFFQVDSAGFWYCHW
jgi:hypothetical protein